MTKLRVCFSNPCWRDENRRGIRAGCRVPNMIGAGEQTFIPFPFLLAYGMAALEAKGVPCLIVDAIAEGIDEDAYLDRVVRFAPDLIVNEIATASLASDLAVAAKLKQRTGARIALCGPHASALPADLLADASIDFVLMGEIEATVAALVDALDAHRPVAGIAGLAWKDDHGRPVIEPRRPLAGLDTLPQPHRETLPLRNYRVGGYPAPTLYMYASRGCPFRCTYCLWPQTLYESGRFRAREVVAVVDEIEETRQRFGPFRSVYFDDDTFNVGKARMQALADELARRSWRLPFGCNARADLFDQETLDRLAAVGLFNIRIGVESGDLEILARARKDLDLERIPRCIDMAHRAGVRVHVTFTVGLSGESWDSVHRTIDFALRLRPDSVAFTITTPYPGTAYYDEVVEAGNLEATTWEDFNVVKSSAIRTAHMSADEITRAEKLLMRKVYYAPRFLLRRLRYAANAGEILALLKKGSRLVLHRY